MQQSWHYDIEYIANGKNIDQAMQTHNQLQSLVSWRDIIMDAPTHEWFWKL